MKYTWVEFPTTRNKVKLKEDLMALFSKVGNIRSTFIARDPKTKKNKGFAFLRFENPVLTSIIFSPQGFVIQGKRVF